MGGCGRDVVPDLVGLASHDYSVHHSGFCAAFLEVRSHVRDDRSVYSPQVMVARLKKAISVPSFQGSLPARLPHGVTPGWEEG